MGRSLLKVMIWLFMDSIVNFQRLLGALRFYSSRWPSGRMDFVKTKRILTGLPDDRKNVPSFTGDAAQKIFLPNATSKYLISCTYSVPRRAFANFAPLRLCEKLASRGFGSRKGAKAQSSRRLLLESHLGSSNHETSATNIHECLSIIFPTLLLYGVVCRRRVDLSSLRCISRNHSIIITALRRIFRKASPYDHPSIDIAVHRELVRGLSFRQRSLASIPRPGINRRRRRPTASG